MKDIDRSISLLLMLAEKRIKAFPTILAIIETIFAMYTDDGFRDVIEIHLNTLLKKLAINPDNNRYLISWIVYFLKSNKLKIYQRYRFSDPVVKAIYSNRKDPIFMHADYTIFRNIKTSKKAISLIEHIDLFRKE